ncbi:O-antigen acetylase [Kitasatospora xanthocidica]|uniref:acyltransferase family protein n=1 Tax=Kitasatospora xanthocidica TaxID=83382 RepID=UPI0016775766|nr:acyltransferase [Kitasatospora xanthocidica]GHF86459.1 O-antigen acetylase [Kitasatospora xanthocidica]
MPNRRPATRGLWRSRGTVAELFSGRDNSLGFIRLVMASSVIVSHAGPIAFGTESMFNAAFHGQTNLGNLSVYGFFVLSGVLVTRSGARLGVGRFLWHRALRLLPGLWACLLVTGFVIAPLMYHRLHGGLAGFWHDRATPLGFLRHNLLAGQYQSEIGGVMTGGAKAGRILVPEFNGSLWSLRYEMLCYAGVALLAWSGVLRRARRVVLVITAWFALIELGDALGSRYLDPAAVVRPLIRIPHMGGVSPSLLIPLIIAFGLGALIELYRDRIRVNDLWGALAGAVFVTTLFQGWFFVIGLPAFAYLLLWLAIRLPRPFRRIGARHDISYGLYIYGFPVEQLLLVLGAAKYGQIGYRVLAVGLSAALAALSWHLIERPALKVKDIRIPPRRDRPAPAPAARPEAVVLPGQRQERPQPDTGRQRVPG